MMHFYLRKKLLFLNLFLFRHDVGKKKKKQKKNKSRYFQKKLDEENEVKNLLINPEPMDIQEFLKCTESFNQTLRNEPHNVKMWLDYVRLQVI